MLVRAKDRVQWILLGVALAAAAALAAPAGAAPDSIVIIGDSISDDGKLRVLAPGRAPPAPYYWMGRFSNGPSYAELISDELGVAEDQVFNFAIGGARSGSGEPTRPIDALDQVAQAIGRGAVSPNGLAVYFIGANDLSALFEGELPGVTPQAHVATVIGNVATGIGRLAHAGQKRFVLVDMPDIGKLPAVRSLGAGTAASATALTDAFNAALRQTADGLESQLGIDVAIVSFNDLFDDLLASSSRYGLENLTTPCFVFNHTRREPLPPAATGACPGVAQASPSAAENTLYWDPFHPTARVHAIAAEFLAANVDALAEAGADIVSRAALGNLAAGDRQRLVETRLAALSGTPDWAAATAERTTPGGWTVYLAGSIRDGAREGESSRRGFEFNVRTVMLGVEGMPGRAVLAGAALGQSTGSLVLDGDRGESDLDAVFGSVYGRIDGRDVDGRGFYVGAAAGASRDRHELGRPTGFSPYPSASASPDGTTRSLLVSGGYDFPRGNTVFGPVFGARWSRSSVDAYVEDAGPIALSVAKQDLATRIVFAGGRIERRSVTGSTVNALPYARIVVEHEANGGDVLSGKLPSGESVRGKGGDTGSALVVNGGLRFRLRDSVSAHVGAEAAVRRDTDTELTVFGRVSIRY